MRLPQVHFHALKVLLGRALSKAFHVRPVGIDSGDPLFTCMQYCFDCRRPIPEQQCPLPLGFLTTAQWQFCVRYSKPDFACCHGLVTVLCGNLHQGSCHRFHECEKVAHAVSDEMLCSVNQRAEQHMQVCCILDSLRADAALLGMHMQNLV